MSLPRRHSLGAGVSLDDVFESLEAMRVDDIQWRSGRAFSLAYHAGDDVLSVAEEAYRRFSGENALNVEAFPSLRVMASQVVDTVLGWTNAPDGAAGFMTSGGTESLILCVWAALRRRHRESGDGRFNVVLPTSAHAAFEKACLYFGVESRRVAVRDDWRADADAMRRACDQNTILMVCSAPQYPQGVVDDVSSVAAVAAELGLNCHVDACMGGVTLAYMERAGTSLPPWDFRVDGVTSMSIDLHKYGYASKGAGVLVHRTKKLRSDQVFMTDNWLGGMYGSSGILGTKSGGAIASAWAVMHYLGDEGYTRVTSAARRAAVRIAEHVASHPALRLVATPDTTLLSFCHESEPDLVVAIARELRQRGWFVDVQGPPLSIHLTVNAIHEQVVNDFLDDLDDAVLCAKSESSAEFPGYGVVE